MKQSPLVAVIVGSRTDSPKLEECLAVLDKLGIAWERSEISCHRTPEDLDVYIKECLNGGVKVIIAAAGMAAHLPGAIAAKVRGKIVVLGVALSSTNRPDASDAVDSIIRMPPGIALSCCGIDSSGGINAALTAASILVVAGCLTVEDLDEYYRVNTKSASVRCESGPRPKT